MAILKNIIYTQYINENMSRIMTQMDRDKDSKTYGSCDRNYWHLKIRDFSSAILQQTCLTLALAYSVDYAGNVYYKNELVKEWAIAALRYMGKIQLKDGSFNEYYPNEHGFPPTAFCLFAACKTYQRLDLQDDEILSMMEKAAKWLMCHQEKNAYNQEIAAIAGLYLYYMITGKQTVLEAVNRKVDAVLYVQSKDGWFPEQGGADIGYSSVAFDMLMEYYAASRDDRVKAPAIRLLDFLSYFVHPDGTIGGEYGSRNTIYFMPNGLETFVALGLDEKSTATAMLQMIYIENRQSSFGDFMNAVDERYLSHYVMHSYWRALERFVERQYVEVKLPFNTIHSKIFADARLHTVYTGEYFAIIGENKGGVIKVFKENREIFWDCGYRIKMKEGTIAATNWLDKEYQILDHQNEICIKGRFNKVTPKIQNPIYHLGLRVSALVLGDKVNRLVKKMTIFQDKHSEETFERKIILGERTIMIEDTIHNPQNRIVEEASNVSLRLVASGKFFSRSDILRESLLNCGNGKHILIKKELDIVTEQINTQISEE